MPQPKIALILQELSARESIGFPTQSFLEKNIMKSLAISLAAGASALFATAAFAAPLAADAAVGPDGNI
jgi:hypothetical protein